MASLYLEYFLLILLTFTLAVRAENKFEVKNDSWIYNGNPVVLRSGDLHYFRVPPSLWEDKIVRLAAMGLNTIQTYVPWNYHELDFEGNTVDFTGERDLFSFLDLASKHSMFVLLRPGPYICAEWDFGGLPARLLAYNDIKIRTNDDVYMKEVRQWFNILLPRLKNQLVSKDGPIIAMQIENEYGFWGNVTENESDKEYLQMLVNIFREHLGDDILLYTTDYTNSDFMRAGTLPGNDVISLGDFGPFNLKSPSGNMVEKLIKVQKEFNGIGLSPPMCTEYYTGWLTHWGEQLAKTPSEYLAESLEYMLSRNVSVNLYMASGGTNYGFWAGANYFNEISFDITSYDYNAPLSESGMHNFGSDGIDKFNRIRKAFQKYFDLSKVSEPDPLQMLELRYVNLTMSPITLVEWIKQNVKPIHNNYTLHSELLGQRFGITLYSTIITKSFKTLVIDSIHDRAQVFIGGKKVTDILRKNRSNYTIDLSAIDIFDNKQKDGIYVLDILVENLGRVNFGHKMYDRKGLIGGVTFNGQPLENWNHYVVEFTKKDLLRLQSSFMNSSLSTYKQLGETYKQKIGRFYYGSFTIFEKESIGGTFIHMNDFCFGYVWINYRLIGRYWSSKGPQTSLYIPGEYLFFNKSALDKKRKSKNRVFILEMDSSCSKDSEKTNVRFSSN